MDNNKEIKKMKILDIELNKLFMQYLDAALAEFESPHSMSDYERLDVYRRAFKKVVSNRINLERNNRE